MLRVTAAWVPCDVCAPARPGSPGCFSVTMHGYVAHICGGASSRVASKGGSALRIALNRAAAVGRGAAATAVLAGNHHGSRGATKGNVWRVTTLPLRARVLRPIVIAQRAPAGHHRGVPLSDQSA